MKNLSDTYPSYDRAVMLRKEMDLSLLDTLKYLIVVAYKNSSSSFDKHIENINEIANKVKQEFKSLPSSFYVLNSYLQNEMKNGNAIKVYEIIEFITELSVRLDLSIMIDELKENDNYNLISESFLSVFGKEYSTTNSIEFEYSSCENYSYSRQATIKALSALEEIDEELSKEIKVIVSDILILNSNQINAGSSFFTYGLIYLKELSPNQHWTTYLEHIVHESAHLHLYSLWKNDAIVLNKSTEKFKSPLRKDLRPMSGLFHAMFVLARLVQLEKNVVTHPKYMDVKSKWNVSYNNAGNNAPIKEKFFDAFSTISQHGILTPLGNKILANCEEMVTNRKS